MTRVFFFLALALLFSPTSLFAEDDTDNAQTSDYSFGIPGGAVINGIEVKVEANESVSSGNIPLAVSLSWNDGSSWTSVKTATVDGTTDANYTLGNSTDTWGRSWTDAELGNGTFRAKFDKQATSDTLNIDLIQIKVTYTTSGTASTTTQYIHTDWLGGTNVVTDQNSNTVQVLDYYPYGTERINAKYGTFDETRKFAQTERDADTSLDYAQNRYLANTRGQFLSIDPVFYEIGLTRDGKAVLLDPQLQNSYAYARDNPVLFKDPEGRCAIFCTALIGAGAGIGGQFAFDVYSGIQSGGIQGAFSSISSGKTYLTMAAQGAALGATGFVGGNLSIVAQMSVGAVTSGLFGAAGSVYLGDPVTAQSVFIDSALGALTFGASARVPGLAGAQPKFGSSKFFTGKNTQRNALDLGFGVGSNYTASLYGNTVFTTQQFTYTGSGSINASQARALGGIRGAFQPTNDTQAAAVQRVISAFTQKRKRKFDWKSNEIDDDAKIYRAEKSSMLGGVVVLIIILALTIVSLAGPWPIPRHEFFGLIGFWLLGIAVTLYPFGFKLKIGKDYVKGYWYWFSTGINYAKDVSLVKHDNLFVGGIGGKGIYYIVRKNGRQTRYSIGENVYGKEAITHAERVLEQYLRKGTDTIPP